MPLENRLDCLVIGHNETPFAAYEEVLSRYGKDAEAYRDLRFSFVEVGGRKMTYTDLLNHVWRASRGLPDDGAELFKSGDIPHLAAVYLTHFLRRRGFAADYVNLFQEEKERLARILHERRPRSVAITTTLYVLNLPAVEVIEFVQAQDPETRVVVGGPLIANHHRNFQGLDLDGALADLDADVYVVEAQGELTLSRIVACLRDGGDLREIPNLILPDDAGGLFHTAGQAEANDLDENAIDWRLVADHDLGPTLQTRTARSCAFKCSFCNYPTRAGKLTLAGVDTLERELDSMAAATGLRNVVFIDDTFNVPLPRFKDICRLVIEKKYGFNWFSYFRCSNADEETFDLMAESGCKGVFLGIESGSNTVLEAMDKRATIEKYVAGIRSLKERGILTFGSFIVGHPGETAETVRETVDFIRSTRPDYYRAQLWYNEHGTPIHARADRYDITGEGFVWSHRTMDSREAMDHIERMFLAIEESTWLPQWSFDFWIIPYLLGLGLSLDDFAFQMRQAHRLLALNFAAGEGGERDAAARDHLARMVAAGRRWNLAASEPPPAGRS